MNPIGRKLIFRTVSVVPFLFYFSLAEASLVPPRQSSELTRIRVRLAESVSMVSIRGIDLKIYQANSSRTGQDSEKVLAVAPAEQSEWEIRCQDGRIRAVPSRGGATLTLRGPVTIQSPAGLIHYRGRPYREEIRIHSIGSLCEVVNVLDIEKYLSGLVNAEFNSQWSAEAVQAQVIAARTYALYQIRRARQTPTTSGSQARFDVDATVKDQVYDGYVSEDYRGARAVEKTRGMVLLAQNGSGSLEPIKAFYHSSCAGQTQLPQDVWGSSFPGFKHRVSCPFCSRGAGLAWSLNLSTVEATRAIQKGAMNDGSIRGWPKPWRKILLEGRLIDLKVGSVSQARIHSVVSVWNWSGRNLELSIPAPQFRKWMGPGRLKSTSFQVSPGFEKGVAVFHITGRGNGHGVGMCQLGAKFMGEKGFQTANILKHYYPDALLKKLW